jgi:hypothetical protein
VVVRGPFLAGKETSSMTYVSPGAARAGLGVLALCLGAALLSTRPAWAGPPFRTDDPEPVEYQHYEINVFSQGTKASGGWGGILPAIEINYGATENLQLHAIVQQGFTSPQGGRTGFGMGDTEIGAKYRILAPEEGDWFPQVAIFPLVEIPTGNQNLGLSTGHAQVFLPIWLQKEFGDWTVYGGGGYWFNPGVGNKDFQFYGVAVWRKITEAFHLGMEVFHQTANVAGSKAATGFNVGATYDLSENWHLLASVGSGLQNRRTTNEFSYFAGAQLTF